MLEDVQNAHERDLLVVPIRHHGLNRLPFVWSGVLKRIDHGQRDLALPQIVPGGLPEYLLCGREVENIVDQLESHTKIPGKLSDLRFRRLIRTGCNCSELGAGREETGCLSIDQLHVIGFRDVKAAQSVELQKFAFHHHLRERDQNIQKVKVAFTQSNLE